MNAEQLISHDLFPLKKNDSVESTLLFMHDWRVSDLPVVESLQVLGFIDANLLADVKGKTSIQHFITQQPIRIVSKHTHFFDLIRIFSKSNSTTLAIVNDEQQFSGIISLHELMHLYKQSALSQPGAIITLQMPSRNYTLTELSRLVEMNDAKIIHVHVNQLTEPEGHIEVSMKINTTQVKNIVSTFDRYSYQITGVFHAEQVQDESDHRFKILMNYLDL